MNAATYLDMTLRGRPASQTPSKVVERLAALAGTSIPGDDEQRSNRESGLGALLGIASGVSAGLVLSGFRALGRPRGRAGTVVTAWALAMVAGNGPMTVLGVTDPRSWGRKAWIADALPHFAYALAATAALSGLESRDR